MRGPQCPYTCSGSHYPLQGTTCVHQKIDLPFGTIYYRAAGIMLRNDEFKRLDMHLRSPNPVALHLRLSPAQASGNMQ